ncbi:cytochrome b [Marinomonas sp.]|uniref:cytochrome b n=1 Tax=Marinomonas sp. TaxID=1904862 RepID=UPI003F9CC8B1
MAVLRGVVDWLDERFPIKSLYKKHFTEYHVPKNLNLMYVFGVLALVLMANQLLTGIWLAMSYEPSPEKAFASIQYIMRDLPYGWLIRYLHTTGASALFIVLYFHVLRSLLYGSYQKPRELVWLFGMTLYFVIMIEGFLGYLLPWGQMSYWGAQVITSIFGSIPVVGTSLQEWVRGDYFVSGVTLKRFYALHVIAFPLLLLLLVFLHLSMLRHVGSNNPAGIDIKKHRDQNGVPLDTIPFAPYFVSKEVLAIGVFLFLFCIVVFFFPTMGGYFLEKANLEPANRLQTPEHIAALWYFTPFYAMLRAVTFSLFGLDAKFLGALVMVSAVVVPFTLPWLDKSPVISIRYKGRLSKLFLMLFCLSFVLLGVVGSLPVSALSTGIAQLCSVLYFAYFLLMPWYSRYETTLPVPERVQ